jgi:hypothetical protein
MAEGRDKGRCPFCKKKMELVRKEHTMRAPKVFYQWSCSCGWVSKLFTDKFEAHQFFHTRNGRVPEDLRQRPKIEVGEEGEPDVTVDPDLEDNEQEDYGMSTSEFSQLSDIRDKANEHMKKRKKEEGQAAEDF